MGCERKTLSNAVDTLRGAHQRTMRLRLEVRLSDLTDGVDVMEIADECCDGDEECSGACGIE